MLLEEYLGNETFNNQLISYEENFHSLEVSMYQGLLTEDVESSSPGKLEQIKKNLKKLWLDFIAFFKKIYNRIIVAFKIGKKFVAKNREKLKKVNKPNMQIQVGMSFNTYKIDFSTLIDNILNIESLIRITVRKVLMNGKSRKDLNDLQKQVDSLKAIQMSSRMTTIPVSLSSQTIQQAMSNIDSYDDGLKVVLKTKQVVENEIKYWLKPDKDESVSTKAAELILSKSLIMKLTSYINSLISMMRQNYVDSLKILKAAL